MLCRGMRTLGQYIAIAALLSVLAQNSPAAMNPAIMLLLNNADKIKLVKTFPGDFDLVISPVVFDGQIWFSAADLEHGQELWRSDGTPEGTVMVTDINPGQNPSLPLFQTVYHGALYYFAMDASSGFELRKTFWDTGLNDYRTVLVKDIMPGANDSSDLVGGRLVPFKDRLFFVADDGVSGKEIWMSDGTAAGTVRVTDIAPGAASAYPQYLTVLDTAINNPFSLYGDILVFSASDGSTGRELWKIYRHFLMPYDYIVNQVRDICIPACDGSPGPIGLPFSFSLYQGDLYFSARENINGRELWRTNGYAAGTEMVKNIAPGNADGLSVQGGSLVFNDELYFPASSGTSVADLWRSDGTESGTYQAFNAGPDSLTLLNFIDNDGLFFSTVIETPSGTEATLWKRYWNQASLSWQAKPVSDLFVFPENSPIIFGANAALQDSMYFMGMTPEYGSSPAEYGLYKITEEDKVVRIVRGVPLHSAPLGLLAHQNTLYFFAKDEEGVVMLLKLNP
ncbi:MAG: ELWxxDGT repeat protein [Desulfobulbaceae bacterium]